MIKPKIKIVSEAVELHVLDFVELSPEVLGQIDHNLVEICEGESGSDLALVKSNFLRFLESKDARTKIGAVAEFFVHLYLRQSGLKQEFLFFNLEEGSIKKGFDGVFSSGEEEYLVESKSGLDSTVGISHKNKLREAYDDISSVISGGSRKSRNNPWKNAYNHASHVDVGTKKSIRAKIKALSDLFDSELYKDAGEFNIVACSSIFVTSGWDDSISEAILAADTGMFENMRARSLKAVCITKATYELFLRYLRGEI